MAQQQLFGFSRDSIDKLRRMLEWWTQYKHRLLTIEDMPGRAIYRGSGGGGAGTLVVVSTAPGGSDLYYKVKRVSAGEPSGTEFHCYPLTDISHLGQPVRDFSHVFDEGDMFYAEQITTSGGSPWFTVEALSYCGPSGSIGYDMTEHRVKAVFGGID